MKKTFLMLLVMGLFLILCAPEVRAAEKLLTLTEDWRLTDDLDLKVSEGDTLVIDGSNRYYIYEMGGILKNTVANSSVYLQNTLVYALADNPASGSLAALSKAARDIAVSAPARDATSLTLPALPGYSVLVKSSDNPGVISTGGVIAPPAADTKVTLVLSVVDSHGNKADTQGISITVPAKTQQNGGDNNNGGNNNNSPSVPTTVPPENKDQASVTQSGSEAAISLSSGALAGIIEKSDTAAVFDVSKLSGVTTTLLPKAAFTAIGNAELGVDIKLPQGNVVLDGRATKTVANQAADDKVKITLNQLDPAKDLSERQKEAVDSSPVYDISITSGSKQVTDFGGGLVAVTLPYELKAGEEAAGVAVYYLDRDGSIKQMDTSYDIQSKTVTFTTNHLSIYMIAYKEIKAWENPFADVQASDWFYADVEYAGKNKLFNGTSSNIFGTNDPVTRGMLVTVLYRLHGQNLPADFDNPFKDVPADEYYSEAIAWAAANKIVTGYGDGLFGPDDIISREQLAVIFLRYADFEGKKFSVTRQPIVFADDASIEDYARESLVNLFNYGIITGKGGNLIDPKGNTTRAEIAAILHRFAENAHYIQ